MANKITISVTSEEGTEQLGKAIARSIDRGIVIALIGTLGAGKTYLVRSIGKCWEIDERDIVSPTFTLCTQHYGTREFHHIDVYRLADDDQWLELEFDELIDDGKVVFIEWAEKFAHLLPNDLLKISIDVVGEDSREFTLEGTGPESHAIIQTIVTSLSELSEDEALIVSSNG